MSAFRARWWWGVVLCGLMAGCPGGGSTGDVPGAVAESPISNTERAASLDQVQQALGAVTLNGDPAVSQQVAGMLAGMAGVANVRVYAGSVVARFTDDEMLVVVNTRPSDGPSAANQRAIGANSRDRTAGLSPRTQALYRRQDASAVSALPKSKKVVLVNAMGTAYTDDTALLSGWFTQAGYQVTTRDGTVEGFRNLRDLGVLYVNSHGAPIPGSAFGELYKDVLEGVASTPRPTVPLEGSDGKDHFFLWTRTEITNDTIEKYRSEVRSGRLAYMIAENDRLPGEPSTMARHFCITEAFAHDNWTCGANALMYIDCCWSANGLLADVCSASPVNASIYVGWSAPSFDKYTVPSERYFFDRLLGVNSYLPTATPQRPYSVSQIRQAMSQRVRDGSTLTFDQSETTKTARDLLGIPLSELTFIYGIDDLLLRPAVKSMKAGQFGSQKTLTLNGTFGDEPGTVTMGGTPLSVRQGGWTNSQIQCDLPGGNTSGAVVVSAGDRASNPRELTEWNLTLRRLFMDFPTQAATNCPSCFYEATIHYTIHADAGPTRADVDGGLATSNYTGAADAGDVDVTNAGGSYSIGQGSMITLAPNPNDGAALIGTCTGFAPPIDNNYFGACFFINGATSQISFSPTLSAEGLFRNYTGGAFDGIVDPYQITYSGNISGNELILPLSPNFNIQAGHQATGPNSYFEWDAANAVSGPDASTAR